MVLTAHPGVREHSEDALRVSSLLSGCHDQPLSATGEVTARIRFRLQPDPARERENKALL